MSLPAAIDALRAPLQQGLARLHPLQLPPDATERLLHYVALLHKWNKAYNLTSVRDPADMLSLHLLDCLATIVPIADKLGGPPDELVDIGSGGGMPGIMYALAWPDCRVHMVDTVGKKVAFLNQCKAELGLRQVQAHHQRIEALQLPDPPASEKPRIFTCRAFASLSDFVRHSWHLRQPGSRWIALKGQWPQDEIEALGDQLAHTLHTRFTLEGAALQPPGLENTQRHLIFIESVGCA